MDVKERLSRLKDVLLILKRERDIRGDPRTTVLQEAWTIQELIGTIEGFLSDNDVVRALGTDAARAKNDLAATRSLLKQWQQAAQKNLLNQNAYRTFMMYSDNVLTTMANQLEQIIDTMPAKGSESQYFLRTPSVAGTPTASPYAASPPVSPSSPQNTLYTAARKGIAMLVLSAAALMSGCGAPTGLRAQEAQGAGDTVITNPVQGKDYVKELDAKLAQVKIEEGKTADWYNEQGLQRYWGEDPASALPYLRKAISMNSIDNYAIRITIGSTYLGLSRKIRSTDSMQSASFLSEADKYYADAEVEARTRATGDRKLSLLSSALIGRANVAKDRGDNKKAKELLIEASTYKKLTKNAQKLLDSLDI